MRIITILILFSWILNLVTYSQQRIAAPDAYLEVMGVTKDGKNITVKSKQLQILYEPGLATGQLNISTLYSEDEGITRLINTNQESKLMFSITLSEGQFAFGNSLNEKFTAEAVFEINDSTTAFLIDFDVSNMRNNDNNLFQIVGRGQVSLAGHLGLTDLYDLEDEVSFMFMQNITIIKP